MTLLQNSRKLFVSTSLVAVLAVTVPHTAQSFSLKDLAGQANKQANEGGQGNPANANDMLNQGIDSIAGEGTAAIINGDVSPEVALAVKQLGIPAQYTPQVQALYDNFRGTGTVTATEVNQQPGLGGWLQQKEGLSASALAKGLTMLFSG